MKLLLGLAVLALASVAAADALILSDGTRVEGKMHKDGDQWIIVDTAGNSTSYTADQIQSFELGGNHDADSATQALASLRHSADVLNNLQQIIDRYNAFLKANPGTPAAEQASADLTTWKERQDQGCVKVGSHWLTPAERQTLISQEATTAAHIGDLVKQEKMQEAQAAVKEALSNDPNDPSAQYLNGLILATLNQNAPARAAFEQVNKIVTGHAASYNNLAVILLRQNQYPAAMNAFIQAMTAAPVTKLIIDNVAEALHKMPQEYQDTPPVVKALAMFTEQDKLLQMDQAAKGRVRWGANWVEAERLPKLQAEEDALKQQKADLQADYDKTVANIKADDSQLQQDQQLVGSMTPQQSVAAGPGVVNTTITGVATTPLPQEYYTLQQDISVMSAAREIAIKHLNELKEHFDRLDNTISVPRYTGLEHLIGPEGTPIKNDVPTTQEDN